MKINKSTDFWGGVMFAAVGLVFAVIAYGVKFGDTVLLSGYAMGTPARMGPAFFPFYLGVILTVIGVIIAFAGLTKKSPDVEKFHWGPIGYVLGSVVLFGLLMKPIGMPLAAVALVFVSSMGDPGYKWKPTLYLSIGLVVFCVAVFVFGLKLPIPLCPDVEAMQNMALCRV